MTRPHSTSPLRIPSYRRHRSKGLDRAFVELNGRRTYLGRYNTPESREKYRRLIAEWLANDGRQPIERSDDLRVVELFAAFMRHARKHYRRPDGTPTNEIENYHRVITLTKDLYGRLRAREFGPAELKAARAQMIARGWSRKSINRQVVRLRSIFKWGVAEGYLPVAVHQALETVRGLQRGRSDAAERPPVGPVDEFTVNRAIEKTTRVVGAMIRLQWLTGMRPGEVCSMRAIDLDTSGPVWVFRPEQHKTAHHGRERVIALGPRAQELITPFLAGRATHAPLFSPAESEAERRAAIHARRTTPLSCGNRPGTNRKSKRSRAPQDRYTTGSYARAIQAACDAAFPPEGALAKRDGETNREWLDRLHREGRRDELKKWRRDHRFSPNQLRHAAATRIRSEAGLEMARAVLGHSTMSVTEQFYAEFDQRAAAELMLKIG
ncbi:MAG: tyrosine-type recombinase/integrase [Phycisphaerales bacterium]